MNKEEVSVLDIFQILRRRWWVLLLCAVVAGGGAAAYYGANPPVQRASMLLDEKVYDILFNVHSRSPYPVWHHMRLGKSPKMNRRVARRLAEAGLLPDADPARANELFSLDDLDSRYGPVLIVAYMPAAEDAVRALELWAEEYRLIAPPHRAKKLLWDARHEAGLRVPLELRSQAVVQGLRRELAAVPDEERATNLRAEVLQRKIVELEIEDLADEQANAFERAVNEQLARVEAADTYELHEDGQGGLSDAEWAAVLRVEAGLDRMISTPRALHEPARLPARVTAIVLTALFFGGTLIVILEWIRAGAASRRRPSSSAGSAKRPTAARR